MISPRSEEVKNFPGAAHGVPHCHHPSPVGVDYCLSSGDALAAGELTDGRPVSLNVLLPQSIDEPSSKNAACGCSGKAGLFIQTHKCG